MQVYVVYKLSDVETNRGRQRSYDPCAVVTSKTGIDSSYDVEELTLTASEQQQTALKTFNEVAKLSEKAKLELGLTPDRLSEIQKQAEPDISLKPGDTVYVTIYRGEDGRSPPNAKEVSSYQPQLPRYSLYSVQKFTLAANFVSYMELEKKDKVSKEISGVSEATKKFLKDFKP